MRPPQEGTRKEAKKGPMNEVLSGITAVSLAVNLPGPLAAARLAELGAQVTKVEPPTGDPLAGAAPQWYSRLIADQQVITLDLRTPAGRGDLDDLLECADLLITSMRPSSLNRLNLDTPQLRFPRLSSIEIVGHDGDLAEIPGHDLNYQADRGILHPPSMPKVPIADLLGAERAVSLALAAVFRCSRDGIGGAYRVSLADAAERAGDAVRYGLMGEGALLGGAFPGYRIYPCADGYVALGAIEPHFYKRVLETFNVAGTRSAIETAFRGKTVSELEHIAVQQDIPLNGVR